MAIPSEPILVLDSGESTGKPFVHPGGLAFLTLDNHSGGTWRLQCETPLGNWINLDGSAGVQFSESGKAVWYGDTTMRYRLSGGTAGASAWLTSNQFENGGGLA